MGPQRDFPGGAGKLDPVGGWARNLCSLSTEGQPLWARWWGCLWVPLGPGVRLFSTWPYPTGTFLNESHGAQEGRILLVLSGQSRSLALTPVPYGAQLRLLEMHRWETQ